MLQWQSFISQRFGDLPCRPAFGILLSWKARPEALQLIIQRDRRQASKSGCQNRFYPFGLHTTHTTHITPHISDHCLIFWFHTRITKLRWRHFSWQHYKDTCQTCRLSPPPTNHRLTGQGKSPSSQNLLSLSCANDMWAVEHWMFLSGVFFSCVWW